MRYYMLRKALLISAIAGGAFSSTSYAGGPTPSIYPSVSPINCVISSSAHSAYTWRDSSGCNEAVSSGFAKGVHYEGTFKYNDGSSIAFSGFITPTQGYTPPHQKGKQVVALIDARASWAKW